MQRLRQAPRHRHPLRYRPLPLRLSQRLPLPPPPPPTPPPPPDPGPEPPPPGPRLLSAARIICRSLFGSSKKSLNLSPWEPKTFAVRFAAILIPATEESSAT